MRTSVLFLALALSASFSSRAFSQTAGTSVYLESLPAIELDKSLARSYHMVTDHYNFELSGNFQGKTRISADFTFQNDSVQWRNVNVSGSRALDAEFPRGQKVEYMENFTYKKGEEIITADFFSNNLPQADQLSMNLMWDVLAFDGFAYNFWDTLELNKEYRATNMNSKMKLPTGTFENTDIRITWLGITKINDEICAILKYSVMNNPLSLEYENVSIEGRSHYWGEIYVSLSDKQIEYACLTEDVLSDVTQKGQADNYIGYTLRYITMSRTN